MPLWTCIASTSASKGVPRSSTLALDHDGCPRHPWISPWFYSNLTDDDDDDGDGDDDDGGDGGGDGDDDDEDEYYKL